MPPACPVWRSEARAKGALPGSILASRPGSIQPGAIVDGKGDVLLSNDLIMAAAIADLNWGRTFDRDHLLAMSLQGASNAQASTLYSSVSTILPQPVALFGQAKPSQEVWRFALCRFRRAPQSAGVESPAHQGALLHSCATACATSCMRSFLISCAGFCVSAHPAVPVFRKRSASVVPTPPGRPSSKHGHRGPGSAARQDPPGPGTWPHCWVHSRRGL